MKVFARYFAVLTLAMAIAGGGLAICGHAVDELALGPALEPHGLQVA